LGIRPSRRCLLGGEGGASGNREVLGRCGCDWPEQGPDGLEIPSRFVALRLVWGSFETASG
jgi:hypothetical protein